MNISAAARARPGPETSRALAISPSTARRAMLWVARGCFRAVACGYGGSTGSGGGPGGTMRTLTREMDMLKCASIAVAIGLLGISSSSAQTSAPACSPIDFPPKCDTWSAAIRDPQTLKQSKQGTICHWYSNYTKKAGYCCENPIVGANGIGTALKCVHRF